MVNFTKLAVAAAVAAGVEAVGTSVCDKYTMALLKDNTPENQATLVTLLVKTAALGSFTGPGTQLDSLPGSMVKVPGILAPGEVNGEKINLMPYFTGELASTNVDDKPTSVNWLDGNTKMLVGNATYAGEPGQKTYQLMTHLVQYFGAALGCSHYGMGFPAYQGDASQTNVHKFMALNTNEVNWFIMQVGLSAKSFGASDEDVKAVGTLLDNTFNRRCAPKATVIPAQGAQYQAICLNSACQTATNADCAAQPTGIFTAESQISTVSAAATPTGAMGSAMPSGGAGATPSTRAGGAPGQASPSAMSTNTRMGAAAATGVSGALVGAAALAALVL